MTVNETAFKRKCYVNKINFNVIVDLWSNTQTTFKFKDRFFMHFIGETG